MGNYFIDSHMIGKSIKNLRLKCHLTQDDLADLVGYSVRHIRRIENNGTSNIDIVNTFAAIFKVAAIDILNGCFLLKIKKRHCRPSPYNTYSNLFFIHMHARLNYE